MEIAKAAMEAGLSGFEFLCGIPGTLGGSVRMNAGAHGRSVADVLDELTAFDIIGKKIILQRNEIPFDYRTNALPDNWIFTEAVLKGTAENKENIQKRMTEYRQIREKAQPSGVKTAGSMFKNPIGLKAWQLIEKAGCRGLKVGGAMVSEKHCNFSSTRAKRRHRILKRLAKRCSGAFTKQARLRWNGKCGASASKPNVSAVLEADN